MPSASSTTLLLYHSYFHTDLTMDGILKVTPPTHHKTPGHRPDHSEPVTQQSPFCGLRAER